MPHARGISCLLLVLYGISQDPRYLSLCNREPAKGNYEGALVPWAGSLWHKRAGVATLWATDYKMLEPSNQGNRYNTNKGGINNKNERFQFFFLKASRILPTNLVICRSWQRCFIFCRVCVRFWWNIKHWRTHPPDTFFFHVHLYFSLFTNFHIVLYDDFHFLVYFKDLLWMCCVKGLSHPCRWWQ